MIDPAPREEPYPGRLPPVRDQWRRLARPVRVALIFGPVALAAVLLATAPVLGAFVTVLLGGSAAATVVYHKNRTDRHNAAVERGEIPVVEDPHLQPAREEDLDRALLARVEEFGLDPGRPGEIQRFDGGWLVKPRRRIELAVVLGDDGGVATFDQRVVSDLRAASEYRAGRGREPTTPA